MPIQAPQWTDYLNCPVCCREFGVPPRSPISLSCGHTVCKHCLTHLHRRQCPFDQTLIQVEPEELVVNTALLQLVGCATPSKPYHPPCVQAASEREKQAYDVIVQRMEELATFLKYCSNAAGTSQSSGRLSRPMQRKLVTLVQCSITDEEGRGKAARAARSLGERTVTELILQHQNPQQLSANLWAAVRARGCQFLGPAMQEEVLKLVLLALEDGSALSRKVLVMFVVQRLEPHFPQASKTSIGHVVQLLYRASCFKVSKRQCDSSLMELKEEFRAYPALRREHDAQIVQIATEAGLRIAPDQWSALLYGDTAHKSHMQSIIDKLQTPQSFAQSVQELFIVLQRTSDPAQLAFMNKHLERLANIEVCPDAKGPSWVQLADILTALKEVVSGLITYQQSSIRDSNQNPKHTTLKPLEAGNNDQTLPQNVSPSSHNKYNSSPCCNPSAGRYCNRGAACQFAQVDDEIERYQTHQSEASNNIMLSPNGNVRYLMPRMVSRMTRPPGPLMPPAPLYNSFRPTPPHPGNQQHGTYNNMLSQQVNMQQVLPSDYLEKPVDLLPPNYYIQQGMTNTNEHINHGANLKHNILPIMELNNEQAQMQNYYNMATPFVMNVQSQNYQSSNMQVPSSNMQVPSSNMQVPSSNMQVPIYQGQEVSRSVLVPMQADINMPSREISPYAFDDVQSDLWPESYQAVAAGRYGQIPREIRTSPTWLPNDDIFNFDGLRTTLPSADDVFNVGGERMAVRPTSFSANAINNTDNELEEEIQELERCLDKVLDK